MSKLRTVVCDDELPALELVCGLLEDTGQVEILKATQTPAEALEEINKGGVDLVVIDIEMPGLNGTDLFRRIDSDPKPLLIFATAHPEYALDAFEADAIDYILKPLEFRRVEKAVEKAQRLHGLIAANHASEPDVLHERGGSLKVRDGTRTFFVPYDDVVWIEAAGDYSLIHTNDREHAMRITITALAKELPAELFERVHRSAIIGVRHVLEVENLAKGEALISLSTGGQVKASRSYREAVRRLTGSDHS